MKTVGLIISIIVFTFCLLNPKIRLYKIICGHFTTLQNDRTEKVSIWDLITFVAMPLVLSAYLCFFKGISLDNDSVNVLLTLFSIFTALLFNFLMLIIQVKENPNIVSKKLDIDKYKKCINQTYYNVSFSTLLSIVTIVLLWIISILDTSTQLLALILNWITISIITMFFLCLLMVLKRIFNIYNFE